MASHWKNEVKKLRLRFARKQKNRVEFYQSLANGCVILSASHEFDDQPGPVRDAVLAYLRALRDPDSAARGRTAFTRLLQRSSRAA